VAAVSTGFLPGCRPWRNGSQKSIVPSMPALRKSMWLSRVRLVFEGKWQELYDEVSAFKQACGASHMKVILARVTC